MCKHCPVTEEAAMRKALAFVLTLAVFMGVAGQAGARKAGGTPPESLQVQNRNAAAASGGTKLTPNKQRFDPYKNFKFR
jgi:hypothetical protein